MIHRAERVHRCPQCGCESGPIHAGNALAEVEILLLQVARLEHALYFATIQRNIAAYAVCNSGSLAADCVLSLKAWYRGAITR